MTRRLLWPVVAAAALVGAQPASADTFTYVLAESSSVYGYGSDPSGRLSPLKPVELPDAGGDIAASADGKSLYVGGVRYIAQFDVGSDGTLAPKRPATVVPADRGQVLAVAASADGRSVFVNNGGGEVSRYGVGADGSLSATPSSHVDLVGAFGFELAVSPNGASLYLTTLDSVAQFDVGADGALSRKDPPTVPAPGLAWEATVSPDGRSLYAAGGDRVYQFDVGADGALSPKVPASVDLQGIGGYGVAVSPDGESLYATSRETNTISQFDVGSGGELAPKWPPVVGAVDDPAYVAISPHGETVYAASLSRSDGWISMYRRRDAGRLAPLEPSRVPTGTHALGIAVVDREPDAPTAGDDLLLGSAARDRIHGRRGSDAIRGLAGDDTLYGDPDHDTVSGDRGADRLRGGSGRDTVYGGPGNDTILVRDGRRDRVFCGRGRDTVRADARDRLRGCERVRR